ncbi:GNAT family N-acetyltransferase [Paenibacillus allorhizosphaerae]|uniref:Uncharacterized protein n=1 Tax=Paenibacillus allorhizosphaerae TaxID=2849866 RepID=A0ABN7TPH0_9BACL|nr:hypothetical protein PAECIP111802_03388 [Paenibacillus allorhizosphaerae]
MKLLPKSDYGYISEIINNSFHCHNVFVYSVIDHHQPGEIYVNCSSKPTSGLVVHRGGSYYVFGDPSDVSFHSALIAFLKNRSNHGNYFDLYVSSMDWIRLLEQALKGLVVRLTRTIIC